MQQNPPETDPFLLAEMRANEHLLWWGRPDPKHRMKRRQSRMMTVRFAIVLSALLLVFIIDTSLIPDIPLVLNSALYLLLLMLACNLAVIFGFFASLPAYRAHLRRQKQLRHTFYAITSQRALLMTTLPGKSRAVASYAREDIGTISREEGEDGWGDLTFGILRPAKIGTRTMLAQSRFSGISNVRQVEEIMFRTFKNAVEPSQPVAGEQIPFEQ